MKNKFYRVIVSKGLNRISDDEVEKYIGKNASRSKINLKVEDDIDYEMIVEDIPNIPMDYSLYLNSVNHVAYEACKIFNRYYDYRDVIPLSFNIYDTDILDSAINDSEDNIYIFESNIANDIYRCGDLVQFLNIPVLFSDSDFGFTLIIYPYGFTEDIGEKDISFELFMKYYEININPKFVDIHVISIPKKLTSSKEFNIFYNSFYTDKIANIELLNFNDHQLDNGRDLENTYLVVFDKNKIPYINNNELLSVVLDYTKNHFEDDYETLYKKVSDDVCYILNSK